MADYDKEREADELWRNAPASASHYAGGKFWRMHDSGNYWETERAFQWVNSVESPFDFKDVDTRPQHTAKQPETVQDASNKYSRNIIGLDGKTCQVDVYRVLEAFEVDSHALAHAIKKLLAPGLRHAKTREQDLKEAIKSIEAELLLMEQRNV